MKKTLLATLFLMACLVLPTAVLAADALSIDIFGPGQNKLNLVLTKPLAATDPNQPTPADSATLQQLVNKNLAFMPFLNLVPASSILGGDSPGGVKGEQIDFSRYKKSQADLVITSGWTPTGDNSANIELRAFSVYNGQLLLGRAYQQATRDQLPEIANSFCSKLMELLTGKPGFFDSTIAFVKRSGGSKEIWTVRPQGDDLRQITRLKGFSMSPAISPDGRFIAFTHVGPTEHTLGIWDAAANTTRTVKLPGNAVISPCYLPNGSLAVALDTGGNSDIVVLGPDFKVQRKLTTSWAIDVSPSFDETGSKMAFVSSRLGNPHIFLSEGGSDGRRISNEGKYNTNPSISPDGKLVVYSRETPAGHRIILHDLTNGSERMLTQGPGSDEDPCFSPDGYFIAFSSTRAGGSKLYLTTRHGDPAVQIPTGDGDASAPAWGKVGGGSAR